ncbi:MAG: divalent-cation tolerance protein CutA [Dehalococcoidales bacterium]|nr:divalent-cation tolerance protein CutA [Dehalococcoidales bacterium]
MSEKKASSSHIVVLVTTANGEEAHKIADRLLSERKAACVNILPGISSFFWWENKLESAKENLLIIKTKVELLDDIIYLVKQLHSDKVPEIIALPIVGGNANYLEWLDKAVE